MKIVSTTHRGRIVAFGATIALAMLAVLPGAWPAAAQTATQTAGPLGTPIQCDLGFFNVNGACLSEVRLPPEQHKGVTGTAGATVQVGNIASGDTVQFTIPAGYPEGAEFTVETQTTITMDNDGNEVRTTTVLSMTCTGNCTEDPIEVQFNMNSITPSDFESFDAYFNALKAAFCSDLDDACDLAFFFALTEQQAPNFLQSLDDTRTSFHSIVFVVGPEQDTATRALQVDGRVQAQLVGDGILQADLPPGDWGIEIVAVTDAPDAPLPADTGAGLTTDDGSPTSTVAWVVGALVAVAVAGGAGAQMAARRRRR